MKSKIKNIEDLQKKINDLQKLKDDGTISLYADGMLKAYNDLYIIWSQENLNLNKPTVNDINTN